MNTQQISAVKKITAIAREHFGHGVLVVPPDDKSGYHILFIGHPQFATGLLMAAAESVASGEQGVDPDEDDEPPQSSPATPA